MSFYWSTLRAKTEGASLDFGAGFFRNFVFPIHACQAYTKSSIGAKEGTRTPGQRGHNPLLYQTELPPPYRPNPIEPHMKHADAPRQRLEHVSASRQAPNGMFLTRAPVFSEFLFFRYIKEDISLRVSVLLEFSRYLTKTRRAMKVLFPRRTMARPAGLEPATLGFEGRCSIQLSYGRSMHLQYADHKVEMIVTQHP